MLRRGSSIGFFGIRDFPYLKIEIRELKAKSERDSGLTVCAGRSWEVACQKTLGVTGLNNLIGDPLRMTACFSFWVPITDPPSLSVFGKLHLNSHFIWPLSNTPAI